MKPNLKLVEARGDDVTFTFGRFNPPTIGHEKLMDATQKIGRNYRVYASHTQDANKNPLDYRTKVKYMKRMFPTHSRKIKSDNVRTAIDVAVKLHDEGFKNLTMVVGSDRVREFKKLLDDYNGKEARHGFYEFNTIKVKSAGERDPDAEGVSGMSASKMRKAAQSNDYKSFAQGLPLGFRDGKKLFKDVQKNMRVKSFKEWTEDLEEASLLDALKIATGKKLFQNEYKEALKTYRKFRQRGDKPADALHRASSTYRHVNARELRKYIEALNPSRPAR
jgi:hypothetical protein